MLVVVGPLEDLVAVLALSRLDEVLADVVPGLVGVFELAEALERFLVNRDSLFSRYHGSENSG